MAEVDPNTTARRLCEWYKNAGKGDTVAQSALLDQVHQLRDQQHNPQGQNTYKSIMDNLNRMDPKAGAAVSKAVVEGDGSLQFRR